MEKLIEWNEVHQPYEFDYHKHEGVKWCSNEEQFQTFWGTIKDFIKPKGKVIDIGCGPRPPFKNSTIIEPLAEKYQTFAPREWWEGITVYSQPAEVKIPKIKADTVVIWNCIDHTYDWRKIIDNANSYLKKGGTFVVATDIRPPCLGHPGVGDKDEFIKYLEKYFIIVEIRENFQERHLAIKMKKND